MLKSIQIKKYNSQTLFVQIIIQLSYLILFILHNNLGMKHRVFNIRHITRNTEPSSIHHSNNDAKPQAAPSFQQFFSMFKTFIQSNTLTKPIPINSKQQYQVEPRDREVSIDIPQPNSAGKLNQRSIKQWTTSVIRDIFSSAFNSYSRNEMTFEQAKIYCSQNFFQNLVRINQYYELNQKDLEMMDSHIKNGILSYMEAKYPLTDSSVINKRLQQVVKEVDSIQSLANNYFTTSPIVFELRKSANYNDLIMLMINDLISKSENSGENSSFYQFDSFMSDVFSKVEDQDWVKKQAYPTSQMRSDSLLSSYETQQHMIKRIQEKEKYRANVKEFTHFLIGKKISENTSLYSEKEIQSGILDIKSPQILRILTKWCEQLEDKYKNRYFSNRSESVKVQRGNKVKSLLAWMRQRIDDDLEKQKESIDIELQEMYKNNYQMQVKIMKHELERTGDEHIDKMQKVSGKFSYKIVNNLRQYIIDYLNKLIHGILKAAKRVHTGLTESIWPSPPCLLSFKIGDLLRCKCSSREKEILRIYEEINRLSKENPEKMKIVRIKNRLKTGTNDILMNIRFNDSVLCEIQLAIDSKTSTFIKCSNMFHHYIYELQRSLFGPISQLCSIWSSLDNRFNLYKQLAEQENKELSSRAKHECIRLNTCKMVPLSRPFMCSSCKRTYCHNSFIESHLQCKVCSFSLCVRCRIEDQDIKTSKTRFLKEVSIIQACGIRVDRKNEIPKFGVCLDLKLKLSQPIPYTIVSYQKVDYVLKKQNGEISEICRYITEKDKSNFRNNYIFFSITNFQKYKPISQKQAITKFILPLMMKQNFKKQKDTISLMGLQLTTEECRQILSVGDHLSKQHIRNMFLSTNNIDELPFSASTFPNIEWLTLSKNKNLRSVTGIGELRQLRKLVMSTFAANQLFAEIYDCVSLEQLAIEETQIATINEKVSCLQRLKFFKISDCKISTLPEGLFQIKSLTTLDLHSNQLTEVGDQISKLQNLQTLNLDKNRLKKVSDNIGRIKGLKELSLQSNPSLAQSLWLGELTKLQKLNICQTKIEQIIPPECGFAYLLNLNIRKTKIKMLHAEFTKTTSISVAQFSQLEQFSLQNFKCQNITDFTMQKTLAKEIQNINLMKKLTDLRLQSDVKEGEITLLSPKLLMNLSLKSSCLEAISNLKSCTSLLTLRLGNNSIAFIPEEVFSAFRNIQVFQSVGNPLIHLPKSLLSAEQLNTLTITGACLASFFQADVQASLDPASIYLPNLYRVIIQNGNLTQIPLIVCLCPTIQVLAIRQNKLAVIRPEIARLTSLRELQLWNNQIEVLPLQLQMLVNLEIFYVYGNKLTNVPLFMENAKKLTIFQSYCTTIKNVECADWILSNQKINFGRMKELTKKIRDEQQNRIKQQTKNTAL